MEAALKVQSWHPGLDRRRDMEILGLLKPRSVEPSGAETSANIADFSDFEVCPGAGPESWPRWM
jgi:hypothetical protein